MIDRRMGRVCCFVVAAALGAGVAAAQEAGSLRVAVMDQDWDVPVNEATVYLLETDAKRVTSPEGQALFEGIEAGTYTLSVSATGFERKIVRGVVVVAGQVQQATCTLQATYTDMDEFVVKDLDFTAAGSDLQLLDIRAASLSVVDAVGADMMSKAGASTAAGALKMVTGTTIQDGKYAVIRGLGDRYTSAAVNGVRLPNADRDRRAVSLDQFPSAIIESIQVNKTFMPDQQGDATGGINIVTKGVPDKPILQVSVSHEYDTNATGNEDFKTYGLGGGNDLAGMRGLAHLDVWRKNKSLFPRGGEEFKIPWTDDDGNERVHVGQHKQYGTGIRNDAPPWNYGFKLTAGDLAEAGDWTFGGLLLGSYSQKYKYRRGLQTRLQTTADDNNFSTPTGINRDKLRRNEVSIDEQLWSAGLTLGAKNEHNNVRFTTLYTHQSRDSVELKYGPGLSSYQETPVMVSDGEGRWDFDDQWNMVFFPAPSYLGSRTLTDTRTRAWQSILQYVENANASVQLAGDHTFSRLNDGVLDWGASFNMAESLEPDRREIDGVYEKKTVTQQVNTDPNRTDPNSAPVWETVSEDEARTLGRPHGLRRWQDAREDGRQWQASYKQPYAVAEGWDGWLKGGLFRDRVERTYRNRIYDVTLPDGLCGASAFDLGPLSALNAVSLGEPNHDSIQYNGLQKIDAYYVMGRAPLPKWLDVVGGVRVERTYLQTIVFNAPGVANATNVIRLYRKVDEGYIRRVAAENNLDEASVSDLRQNFGAIGQENTANIRSGDARIEQTDVLPALSVTVRPWEELSLRLSYSETIARPIFKETTPVLYADIDSTRVFVGNPELKMSRLQNYDLRLEFRPDKARADILAAGVFYKTIRDPIQYSTREGAAGLDMDFVFPENYGKAEIRGFELEARKDLGFISDYLKDLAVGGNLTLQTSEVRYRSDMTNDLRRARVTDEKRPMDGQSDVLANIHAVFDNAATGVSLGVFYNWRGEMYLSGDTATPVTYYPSIVEKPVGSLDIVIGYTFKLGSSKYSPDWRLGIELKNLLDPLYETVYRTPRKDIGRSIYSVGRTYGISLGCTW